MCASWLTFKIEPLERLIGCGKGPQRFSLEIALNLRRRCLAFAVISIAILYPEQARAQLPISTQRQRAFYDFALTESGDAENGQRLFNNGERTKCSACHVVDGKGGEVGPDLSRIGGKFDRPHLIESLLEPSKQIVEGYRAALILTDDGQTLTGIIKNETAQSFVLHPAEGEPITLMRDQVDAIQTSALSLMPDNLAEDLTKQEFVDLVSYLETLRTGFNSDFGAGVSGPVKVGAGFKVETVTTNISGATAMQPLPDGRILICEQTGALRVLKNGRILEKPMLEIQVDTLWERGLIGVTVSPDFPKSPYVYVVYVAADPYPHHRVSRFEVAGDVAVAGSERILLRGDDQRELGGHVPAGHQGGAIHFGNDGKLYIGIGEQTAGLPAQALDTLQGKILRINPDGSIPDDNPLLDKTSGKYQAIWAYGCRNPFTFAFERHSELMMINDVGGKFEEINRGVAGANYGWPTADHGPVEDDAFTGPQHIYPEASISGGDFLSNFRSQSAGQTAWPSSMQGKYFFADFVHGWIKWIDPADPLEAHEFAYGLRRPVDVRFAADGALYVLLRNAWVIDKKFEGGTGSLMKIYPQSDLSQTERWQRESLMEK